ncbi:MAG: MFS transporter [Candidatus Rehaiarchaeum fermentans]|nr:MFS transporter [Candidatus Rehaiarchaeum fermentans]
MKRKWYVNEEVLKLSLSAFFADAGYQVVLSLFPIFFVFVMKESVEILGILYAIQYGGGALFAYLGGNLAEKFDRKRLAIIGNSLISLLSFIGLSSYLQAEILYILGWWARDFRTPARRSLVASNSSEKDRKKAFGTLHLLDIGGGIFGLTYLIILLINKVSIKEIFLITLIPLVFSTVFLAISKEKKERLQLKKINKKLKKNTTLGILIATSLFGFSYYSLGYPIITVSQISNNYIEGVFSYFIYLFVSSISGYFAGTKLKFINSVKALSTLGYIFSAIGSLFLAYSILSRILITDYIGLIILGFSLGIIETFEPAIISVTSNEKSSAFGYLSMFRSLGLFTGNLLMGILYVVNPSYSYIYATLLSFTAGIIVYLFGRKFTY